MQLVDDRTFRFEGFVLDLRRGSLSGPDGEIALRPKSFEVLRYLLTNAGRLVPKDEIIRVVWPNVNVTDESLTRCLSDVRLALGDPGRRIIKTAARRGYLFAASVSVSEADPGPAQWHATDRPAFPPVAIRDWVQQARQRATNPMPPGPRPLSPIDDRPSIAVLPFVSLSLSYPSADALAYGLTEEATMALAHIPGIFVTARHSAMVYRDVAMDAREIASELGVRYLLEGSVDPQRRRLRVHARLIDGRTGQHLWAETLEQPAGDVMNAKDQVVVQIASRLQPDLMEAEIRRALDRPTANLDAWTCLQRANSLLSFGTRAEALSNAIAPLRRALDIDPDYAMAHALLGAVHTWRVLSMAYPDRDDDERRAREHAEAATRIEPQNPFVLRHCAETALYAGDIDGALAQLERATTKAWREPHGLALLAHVRRYVGLDPRGCVALIEEAQRISPRDPRTYQWHHFANWCHFKLGRLDRMEAECRHSIALYSNHAWSWLALVCALGLQRRTREARDAATALLQIVPEFTPSIFFETAKRLYGKRFPGEVEAEYAELRDVLSHAMA